MATAYAAGTSATQTADNALVLTKPTGLAAGDILVAFCMRDGDGSGFDTPANWTSLGTTAQSTNFSVTTFAKIADAGDAAASNFSFSPTSSSGDGSMGAIARITGTAFTSIAANVQETAATDTPALSIAGLTTTSASSILLMFWANTDGTGVNYSAHAVANNNPSWTHQFDEDGSGIFISLASASYTPVQATGNFSVTASDGTNFIGVLVSIVENTSITASPSVINIASSVQAPTVTGGANVTVASPVTLASSVVAPTVSLPSPEWTNPDKSSSTWTNPDKS